ncbi:MAG: tetratricopeptide repeat protein, partial [Planctomycetota bacterium]
MSNALPVALGSNGVRPAPCAVRWTFVVLALTGWWAFAGGAWAGQDDDLTLDDLIDAVVQGDYEDAEEIVEEIPSSAERYLWHARLLRETGRSAKARELLAGAPAKIQEDPRVQTRLGGLLVECGQWKEAEQVLGDALLGFSKTAPDRVEALARLGLLQKSMGKTKEARRTLQDVVAFYQKLSSQEARSLSPQLYVWMGKACEGLNRYRDAYEVMYSSAFDVEGEHVTAHVASGNILLEKYNYPDARSHFKDGIKENPDFAEAHIGLAKATYVDFQYPRNRFIDTLRALKAADRIWKDHPETLRLRGDLAFFDENWIDAEDYYRRAIASCPPNLTYQAQLGVVFYATHRLEELTALEAEVAKLHPKPAEFYSAMAAKLVDRFFYEESANFARKAVELDPDYWPAYVTLGVNALRVGKDEEGREFINKAFEHDKFNVWAFNTRVLNRHIDKNFVETKTGDFTFRLHREDRPFLLPYLRPLMESAKKRMEAQYEVTLSKPIVFEDFSKHTYFSARSIGLPGLAASGVCFGKLVTLTTPKAIPGNWGSVAIHEFGHVVALHKAKQRVPRWLTEGLSVFEEGRDDPHWVRHYPDEFAEGVFYDGLLPIGQLQSGFTKPDSPGRILLSYYQGGVICRYITENYGFDKIV